MVSINNSKQYWIKLKFAIVHKILHTAAISPNVFMYLADAFPTNVIFIKVNKSH